VQPVYGPAAQVQVAALGRNNEAIDLLQRASAHYYAFGPGLHIEPTFDGLKNDPGCMTLVTAR